MPKAIEAKLKRQYPGNDRAVYGTMAKIAKRKKAKVKSEPVHKKLGRQLMGDY